MNKEQEEWLKANGVSAKFGVIVKDKYGALHAIDEMTVGMSEWCYQHGLVGPSPELGKSALEFLLRDPDRGLTISGSEISIS